MPLIKRGTTGGAAETPAEPKAGAAAQLFDSDAAVRWKAARVLGEDAGAVDALARALETERSPQVREAIFTSLVLIRSAASAQAAAAFIRSDDAAMRTGALDALAAMPEIAAGLLPGLLTDADADVRLLSCELARNLDPETATRLLGDLVMNEAEANVCGAAVEVLAEVGTPDAAGPLLACKARFPGEAFLGFAIDDAIERCGANPRAAHE